MAHAERFVALVNEAKHRVREIQPADVLEAQHEGATLRLIDVREDHEWAAAHIQGAEHVGRGILEREIERVQPDLGALLILYCGGGYRSALAADSLQQMGYTNVRSMAGGIRGWGEAGYPLG